MADRSKLSGGKFLNMSEGEASQHILELNEGMFRTQTLFTVCDLGIPDIVLASQEPVSIENIVSQISQEVDCGVLCRVMRYVSAHGVFLESASPDGHPLFSPTKVTEQLSWSHPFSGSCASWIAGRPDLGMCLLSIHKVVKKEINPDADLYKQVNGKSVWENFAGDAAANEKFQLQMKINVARSINVVPHLVSEVEDGQTVMDVGGGTGSMMSHLYEKRPKTMCINFDLPNVIDIASPREGVSMVAGDMFKAETFPKCDVLFMKFILHDWKDEKCVEILRNCHSALPANGKLISVGVAVPEAGQVNDSNKSTLRADLMMLIHFGSKERTAKEFKALFSNAGFSLDKIIPVEKSPYSYKPLTMFVCHKI